MRTRDIVRLTVACISLAFLTLLMTADASFADRRDRRYDSPRRMHNERAIVRQRIRHVPRWAEDNKFFYRRGAHYRPFRSSYYPPRIRVVSRLPYGYRTIWLGDTWYFSFRGTFYERAPSGYLIVTSPPETVIVREASVSPPVEPASGNVLVTVPTLNVRSGPGLDYSLVQQIKEGSILKVRGKIAGWLYVEMTDGQSGWVNSLYTEPLEPGSG